MALDAGGHLTHGFRPNISGKMFHQQQYGTDPETGLLDYDAVAAKAREFKPLVLVAGYSAYPRRVNFAKMREIADEVGAVLMVDMAHFAGPGGRQGLHRRRGPRAARPRHHHDHAQVAARPARRARAGPGGVRRRRRPRLPDGARRPALARDGRQGRRPGRGPAAVVPDLRAEHRRQRQVAGRGLPLARRDAWSPAAPTTTSCCSTCRRTASPAARPSRRCSTPAWSPTATRCPSDPNGAWYTSGIRFGTPALTTRGFGARRVRHGGRPGRRRALEHLAGHQQGRGAVEGDVQHSPTGSPTACAASATEMLDKHPLYPGLELT